MSRRKASTLQDMTAQVFGHGLVVLRHAALGYCILRCPAGHEFSRKGSSLRDSAKKGFKAQCPECAEAGVYRVEATNG